MSHDVSSDFPASLFPVSSSVFDKSTLCTAPSKDIITDADDAPYTQTLSSFNDSFHSATSSPTSFCVSSPSLSLRSASSSVDAAQLESRLTTMEAENKMLRHNLFTEEQRGTSLSYQLKHEKSLVKQLQKQVDMLNLAVIDISHRAERSERENSMLHRMFKYETSELQSQVAVTTEIKQNLFDRVCLLEQECDQLRKTLDREKARRECVVCQDNEVAISCRPCNHVCLCASCSTKVACCPICRQVIVACQEVYV
eukprot:GILJ01002780.1.p1 GENE.GILJ01002780.1~~GILJ01002780.1.p1  ORF type:complete len:254 (+),score=18.05 GILJ01002780.1:203-964(+)